MMDENKINLGMEPTSMEDEGIPICHVDFIPQLLQSTGILGNVRIYETFDVLVSRANAWLQSQPSVRVITVETVEQLLDSIEAANQTFECTTYSIKEKFNNYWVLGLRLWLKSSPKFASEPPQQLGLYQILPVSLTPDKRERASYEGLQQTLGRLNERLRHEPLPGRVLNLEMTDMPCASNEPHPDVNSCHWVETEFGKYFIKVLRLFYVVGPPAYEVIAAQDFVPALTNQSNSIINNYPEFASHYELVKQAREWISQRNDIRVFNVQTVRQKVKREVFNREGATCDTDVMKFWDYGDAYANFFLRFVRVYYTTTNPSSKPLILANRAFTPYPLQRIESAIIYVPKFESMTENVNRVTAWVRHSGAQVLCAETIPIWTQQNDVGDPNVTYKEKSEFSTLANTYLMRIRLWIDGDVSEPPQEVLPPIPTPEVQGCFDMCTIT